MEIARYWHIVCISRPQLSPSLPLSGLSRVYLGPACALWAIPWIPAPRSSHLSSRSSTSPHGAGQPHQLPARVLSRNRGDGYGALRGRCLQHQHARASRRHPAHATPPRRLAASPSSSGNCHNRPHRHHQINRHHQADCHHHGSSTSPSTTTASPSSGSSAAGTPTEAAAGGCGARFRWSLLDSIHARHSSVRSSES